MANRARSACVFCQVIAKQRPGSFVYEDDDIVAFKDIHPKAPTHILVLPREHIASVAALGDEHQALIGKLALVAKRLAEAHGVAQSGFRLSTNTGPDAHQSVPHLHFHLLGGRRLQTEL